MPELPEVESTVRYLRKLLQGLRVAGVRIHWPRTIAKPSPTAFEQGLIGATIETISRRGKYVLISVSGPAGQLAWLIHLRMSGYLEVFDCAEPSRKHDRVVVTFAGGKELHFHDVRKFGRMWLVADAASVTQPLGAEPLDPSLSAEDFVKRIKSRRGRIKPLLLNQRVIAGIGNIYADESLWGARIHPLAAADTLPYQKLQALYHEIGAVLTRAIRMHGTDAGDRVVNGGRYKPRVYGREGKPCPRCKATIRKIVVGQRGTHYCPRCQPRR